MCTIAHKIKIKKIKINDKNKWNKNYLKITNSKN